MPGPDRNSLEPIRIDLQRAQSVLVEAELTRHPGERYLTAHRAALGVAAAVLALHGVPVRARQNVWSVVATALPELAEWAAFFAATQPSLRVSPSLHVPGVSDREADDLIRDAQAFADLVGRRLDAVGQITRPGETG